MEKKFIRFLKEQKILMSFLKNFNIQYDIRKAWCCDNFGVDDVKNIQSYTNMVRPMYYIQFAFSWHSTEEKSYFWDNVNEMWKKELKENQINNDT